MGEVLVDAVVGCDLGDHLIDHSLDRLIAAEPLTKRVGAGGGRRSGAGDAAAAADRFFVWPRESIELPAFERRKALPAAAANAAAGPEPQAPL